MAQPKPFLRVFPRSTEMTAFLLRQWQEKASEVIAQRGFFSAALSGGTAPIDFYRGLAGLRDFPWAKTHIFLVDERFVPWDDRDSNYGMLQKLFLDAVGIPAENMHPITTSGASPQKAAELYEKELRRFFRLTSASVPAFDCLSLGMGEDGHVASLFPGSAELAEQTRLVVPIPEGRRPQARISLSLPVINNAQQVFCIVTGKQKAGIVKRVIEEREAALPASLLQPTTGKLLFVLDADAASLLSNRK